jgi:transcriptional regulator with XRE-family HTH domain
MNISLDTEVRAALEKRRGDWQQIATEAQVSYSWLSKFVNGHIDNPGYATLKRLHEYLLAPAADSQQAAA